MAFSIARFSLIIVFLPKPDSSAGTMLTTVSSYICPEQETVFRCTVNGGVATVWQGSALENCSIILRHSQFRDGHTINETCGTSGQVVGQTISAENGSYTSQLTINITQRIIGSYVVCAIHGEHGSSTQIMSSTDEVCNDINDISSSSYSPTLNVTLTRNGNESAVHSILGADITTVLNSRKTEPDRYLILISGLSVVTIVILMVIIIAMMIVLKRTTFLLKLNYSRVFHQCQDCKHHHIV